MAKIPRDSERRGRGHCGYRYDDLARCIYEGPLIDNMCEDHFTMVSTNSFDKSKMLKNVELALERGL
jgi:hypothetical protein